MISKSSFILGVQCEKSYWFKHNRYPETNPSDDAAKERLSAGQEVEKSLKCSFLMEKKFHIWGTNIKKCFL